MNTKTKEILSLSINYRLLETLHADAENARLHSKRQIKQICQSIESFGFNVPVLIDEESKIIAGHGRVMAAHALGWKKVPTIQLAHLTTAQVRAFAIADNRLTENSSWDEDILAKKAAHVVRRILILSSQKN